MILSPHLAKRAHEPADGRYTLLTRLGAGGMAEVFAALERREDGPRLVAVKRVLPNLASDEEVVAMFHDEAELAARIDHPNVCRAFGLDRDRRYLVMELLEGAGLDQRPPTRDLRGVSPRFALALGFQAAEGLHAAHELLGANGEPGRVVHRDVSPANLFLTTGGVLKILDFGIAKAEWISHQTRAGLRRGKAGYMSPEQVRSQPLDRRSDVFSLGVVLWELLSGRSLFGRPSELDSMHAVLVAPVPGLASAGVPWSIERVIRGALERDPAARWPTARVFSDAIAAAARSNGGLASPRELGGWLEANRGGLIEARRAAVRAAMEAGARGHGQAEVTRAGNRAAASALGHRRAGSRMETHDPYAFDGEDTVASPDDDCDLESTAVDVRSVPEVDLRLAPDADVTSVDHAAISDSDAPTRLY